MYKNEEEECSPDNCELDEDEYCYYHDCSFHGLTEEEWMENERKIK